jgi:transposase
MAVMGSETGMLAYAVATSTGDILEAGDYPDDAGSLRESRAGWRREKQRRQRRGRSTAGLTLRGRTKHTIHTVLNDLVGKAVNHGARILVESPAASGSRQREDVPMAEVRRVLSYKAQLAGLPTPRWAKTWRYVDKYDGFIPLGDICALCGRVLTLTRPHSTISCLACGELDYAVNWSMVVASSAAER